MKLSPSLKEKFTERAVYALVGAVLSAFGFVALSVWKEIQPEIVKSVFPAISKLNLLLACGALALATLVLILGIVLLLRSGNADRSVKKERQKYKHDGRMGIYMHKDFTEAPACSKCWPEINKLRVEEAGWRCMKCGQYFENFDVPRPQTHFTGPRRNWALDY